MGEERSLDLEVVEEGRGERARRVVRVYVANAFAFTRSGGGATITRDCTSLAALEREVERLRAELEDILARAGERLGGGVVQVRAAAGAAPTEEAAAVTPAAKRVDVSLRVRDVMTREVVTVGPNDRLSLADELMKQGRFRHLVVFDDGAVVGVVSQRDVFYGTLAWSMGMGSRSFEQALAASPVKEVMHSDVATIDPEAPLVEAARLMMDRKIGCLPVLEVDRLVGILTEGDFLALVVR
jgi:CBS domain-containing membrane protein